MIFLVGARRSGTNWLERILTAHPEVTSMWTETYLFSHGVGPFSERIQHANPSAPVMGRTFMDRDAYLDATRDFVDRILLETLERRDPGARYIVERTPWHASQLPLIAAVYPDARVINIVRDGRAVARSLVSMPWGPDSIAEAAAEWRDAVADARSGSSAVAAGHYLEVIYEQLVSEPRARTAELFRWLGLELSDEHWERVRSEAGAEFNVDPGSPGVGTDKWRDELSAEELRTVERVAGEQLQACGYALAASPSGERAGDLRRRILERVPAKAIRRPRASARSALDRIFARRLHADQIAHNAVVGRFERCVADGDEAGARAFVAPKARITIDDGRGRRSARGAEAIDDLLAVLARDRRDGARIATGEVHASPYGITTVTTGALADGSRWARTLVYGAVGGRLTEISLYRHELAAAADAEAAQAPASLAGDR